ncbi:DinB family protein [Marinoscillum furvescens]|uniref:DinB family protein n=1 Tax=Marinoscillum furvescens DSM 4134 TaxID=1122208 RepID=A0A3D9L5M3_MARFU|nr:DinB family protein [Marinoscillum furvescens]REE00104.1 DinB family protein [Marinoscillum furvescens DSM 4134]
MKNEYLEEWIQNAALIHHEINELFDGLSEDQLNNKPSPQKWSIGEQLEHLMVSNTLYFPKLKAIAAGKHKNPSAARFTYLPQFFGKSILKAVQPDNEKKLKTSRKFLPDQKHHTLQLKDKFSRHQDELIELVKNTNHIDHKKAIITSPANRLIFYYLEDAIKIILAHERRHIHQAQQLLDKKQAVA